MRAPHIRRRRGWEEGHRGLGRGRYDDDDDYRSRRRYASDDDDYRTRRRYADEDDDGRGHGRGGWFGDSRGHSEASRRGWDRR